MRSRVAALALMVVGLAPALAGDARAALWPDAPDKIKADLASPDVARRRSAAADLVNVAREAAIALVAKALADSDLDVRLAAVVVAARIHMTEAADLLVPW
ncbi:MAG: hypothetical protein K1X94_34550, partial [Sandaracinaceae bacterium]|nr:hypothetical protein [Sandaracinaceae bacterium]